jgi:hypothetical protein
MPTIRTAADKVPATVAGFGKLKDGQYGPYQSVLFEGDRLPEGKVWRSMEPEQAKQFTKGQAVHLVPTKNKQGRDSWDIELLGDTTPIAPRPAPADAPPSGDLSPEQKRAIAAYITARAPLLTYCYQQASAAMPDGSEVAIAAGAAALFQAACKKFDI